MSRALNRYWSESEQPLLNVNEEAGLEEALRRAGFADIQIGREEAEFLFADEEAWWTWQWSHRRRSQLERIEPAILARFKADVFERLQAVKGEDGASRGARFSPSRPSRESATGTITRVAWLRT